MSYNFSQKDIHNIFIQDKTSLIFPKNKGKISMQKYQINKDIALFKNVVTANDDITFESEYLYDNVHLCYQLNGKVKSTCKNTKFTQLYEKNHSTFTVLKGKCNYFQQLPQGDSSSLGILINPKFIQKYLPQFRDIKHTKQIKSNAINPKIQSLINEIYTSPYEGVLNDLYIQSKTLEIVFLEIANLEENQVLPKIKFNDFDIQAIKKAKEYLMQNYANPPSIKELSRIVRLNEFKLKYGFKLHFNITPYQFVLNYRLKQAKVMLEYGELNVSEIAQITGYKHVQNFSNAFCKHFGMTPKSLNKNKTFYF